MRILAVDDDNNIRDLLSTAISAETEHRVWTASNGYEALDLVRDAEEPFDCFLLDIQMPEMDGVDLCATLRGMPDYRHTPILMLTAMQQKKFVDRAFKAGATDYISKPFEFLELFSRLNVAEQIVSARTGTDRRKAEVIALQDDLTRSLEHSLSEPIEILGVERIVGYVSFENYLLQLSRMKMLTTSVFALKILNVEKVFRNLPRASFRHLLSDIAQLLGQAYGEDSDLITYRGNGVFACATSSRRAFSQFELEKSLNKKIRDLAASRMAGISVQICSGEPVSLISLTRTGTLASLQNAVARAEARADSYSEILQMSTRIMRSKDLQNKSLQRERQAYKSLLKEAMPEEELLQRSHV
ncbi:response regulator [Cognatishimia activa]|uniref:Staphylococcal respiratory response protein A n=1 Tax=Cognatishimia activa TaxID=1715691 RepID=A0A0P1J742_9RHOB|nr:response regulator [Cognatishimia activa]CUI98169.1 Staphylococcal respiratory response protein A [Cognatishimia activa]CUK25921.1 Staphylococcal respiratory response protein A [Cognatishimia activa]